MTTNPSNVINSHVCLLTSPTSATSHRRLSSSSLHATMLPHTPAPSSFHQVTAILLVRHIERLARFETRFFFPERRCIRTPRAKACLPLWKHIIGKSTKLVTRGNAARRIPSTWMEIGAEVGGGDVCNHSAFVSFDGFTAHLAFFEDSSSTHLWDTFRFLYCSHMRRSAASIPSPPRSSGAYSKGLVAMVVRRMGPGDDGSRRKTRKRGGRKRKGMTRRRRRLRGRRYMPAGLVVTARTPESLCCSMTLQMLPAASIEVDVEDGGCHPCPRIPLERHADTRPSERIIGLAATARVLLLAARPKTLAEFHAQLDLPSKPTLTTYAHVALDALPTKTKIWMS
ncbi:hypothetical protein R3P38DRAFT_3243549 [Favolaschia claudopus]|uniref:Uncharacterized protein n=1 Tax=Favolaschia claudopus TaxID=2862362 RepID=A0AAV9Z3B5_9AGAR